MNRLIWFAPRVMGILAIGFLSLFALDAFGGGRRGTSKCWAS